MFVHASWLAPGPQFTRIGCATRTALLATLLGLGAMSAPAASQSRVGVAAPTQTVLSIEIGTVVLGEPGAETRLTIGITPMAALPANSFLRIKGLPASVQLTDGHQIAAGAWAIPIDGLAKLRIKVQPGTQGKSELSLSLFSIEGRILAEARTALVIAPAGLIASAPEATPPKLVARGAMSVLPTASPTVTPQPAPPPLMSPQDREQAQRSLERGTAQLRTGSMVAARALLERAADLGLAEAAMALAATYDAWELSRLGVLGVQPDPIAARKWYARAQELGAPAAAERIARLPK